MSILILIGFAGRCGATVYNSDGSAASVQGLQDAALNGDTITLPAGNFNWDSQISITKAITLQGAGPGATNITSSYTGGQAVGIVCVPNQTTTIRDFSVGDTSAGNCFFLVSGSGIRQYRFTNLSFGGNGHWSIWISSLGDQTQGEGPYGLIDNCTWTGGRAGIYVRDNPNAVPKSWDRPMTFGTEEAVYMEDCTFSAVSMYPNANIGMDGDNGCRAVFRHNTMQDYCIGWHGADSSGPINSTLQHEVMHNTWTVTDGVGQAFVIQFRGGTGVVFDNTFNSQGNGGYNNLLYLEYYRASVGGGGVCTQDRFYPQDYVGTMQPCSGYVGTTGQDPNYPNEPWGSVPAYYWGNHVNGTLWFTEVGVGLDGYAALFMQLGRDYFNGVRQTGLHRVRLPTSAEEWWADTYPHSSSDFHANEHSDTFRHTYCHLHAISDPYTYCNRNANSNAYRNTHANCNANFYAYWYTHADTVYQSCCCVQLQRRKRNDSKRCFRQRKQRNDQRGDVDDLREVWQCLVLQRLQLARDRAGFCFVTSYHWYDVGSVGVSDHG